MFVKFDEYCKNYNIIVISPSSHSFHLIQLFNIIYFKVLMYNRKYELDVFIKAHITYIIKTGLFITFQKAYYKIIPKH
jgi:hypothetical protein